MQFQVPQFETEDKLVGPLTIIQFVYVGTAVIISIVLFPVLTTWFWFTVSSFLVGTSLVIALVKVQGRPMPIFIAEAFRYFWEPKILVFEPNPPAGEKKVVDLQQTSPLSPPKNEVPKQAPAAAELAMPPISTPIAPATAPALSVEPAETFTPPATPSMPVPIAPAKPMKISPTDASAMPSSSASIPPQLFEISDAPVIRKSTEEPIAPVVSAAPFIPVSLPIISAEIPSSAETKRSRLQSLFNQLTTTSSPLLFREESLKQTSPKQKGYEFVEKLTGETIVARRVDYR